MNIKSILCLTTFATTVVCTQNVYSFPININRFAEKTNFRQMVQEISEQSFAHHVNNVSAVYSSSPKNVKDKYCWIKSNFYHSSIYSVINKIISSSLSNDKNAIMKNEQGIYIPVAHRLKDLTVSYWNYTIMYNFIRRTLLPLLTIDGKPYDIPVHDKRKYESLWDLNKCNKVLEETVENIKETFSLSDAMIGKINKAKNDCIHYTIATRLGKYITAQNVITLSNVHRPWTVASKPNALHFGVFVATTKDKLHYDRPINVGYQLDKQGVRYNDKVLSTPYVSAYINRDNYTENPDYNIRIVQTLYVPLYATFITIPLCSKTSDVTTNARNCTGIVPVNFIDWEQFDPTDDVLGAISSFYEDKNSDQCSPLTRVIDIIYENNKAKQREMKTYINKDKLSLTIWNMQDTLDGFNEANNFIKEEVNKYKVMNHTHISLSETAITRKLNESVMDTALMNINKEILANQY